MPKQVTKSLLPSQVEFFGTDDKVCAWISGIGSGKTRAGAWWVLGEIFKYPNNQGMVASATSPLLRLSTIPNFLEAWDELGLIYKYNEHKSTVHFANGSWLKFQTLDIPQEQLKGSELGFCLVDEVDTTKEGHIATLLSRIRRKNTSRRARLLGNSPPPEHWLEKWFLPDDGEPIGRLIQSTTYENIFLPPDYIEQLERIYPKGTPQHDRFVLGKMGVALPNAVWPDYHPKVHIVDDSEVPYRNMVGAIAGLDLGHRNPTCFLQGLVDHDDNIWIVNEHYEAGKSIAYHTSRIDKIYMQGPVFGDWDAQGRHEYEQLGITVTPAFKEVDVGLEYVRQRFRDRSLKIVRNKCPNLCREIPAYQYVEDDATGKERVVKKDDHACDALRYLVAGLDHISTRDMQMAKLVYGALG